MNMVETREKFKSKVTCLSTLSHSDKEGFIERMKSRRQNGTLSLSHWWQPGSQALSPLPSVSLQHTRAQFAWLTKFTE